VTQEKLPKVSNFISMSKFEGEKIGKVFCLVLIKKIYVKKLQDLKKNHFPTLFEAILKFPKKNFFLIKP